MKNLTPVAVLGAAYNDDNRWYVLLGDGVNLWRVWIEKSEAPDELSAGALAMVKLGKEHYSGGMTIERIYPDAPKGSALNNYNSARVEGYIPEEYL